MPLLIVDDLGMRKLPHTAAEDLLELIMRRLRTSLDAADVKPARGRLRQAAWRYGGRHCAARSPLTPRACAQMWAEELAHKSPH